MGSKHIKGSKERYLLEQNTTCEFSTGQPEKKKKKIDGELSHVSVFG